MTNKFGARRSQCNNGHTHSSAKEARRCNDLHLLERAGEIVGLKVEPKFYFPINGGYLLTATGRMASYRPDFTYIENHKQIAEDVKGNKATITEASALRMALFRACHPDIELRLV